MNVRGLVVAAVLAAGSASGHAQGCTQCNDNAAATPPATQRAYRHAITLLACTATAVFTGTVIALRRQR